MKLDDSSYNLTGLFKFREGTCGLSLSEAMLSSTVVFDISDLSSFEYKESEFELSVEG